MRIFKTKTLAKFTRQHSVSDSALVEAVDRAKRGLIDADLGGKIIKTAGCSFGSGQERRLSHVDRVWLRSRRLPFCLR